MAFNVSVKHIQIGKARTVIFAVIIAATIVSIFALFATRALLNQGAYQRRVLAEKHKAVRQLQENSRNVRTLVTQYQIFAEQEPNVLGGNPVGTGQLDGDNGRIVLDALPSKYDFPALTTSIEKIMKLRGVTIRSLGGSDQSSSNPDEAKANPSPLPIEFTVEGLTSYTVAQELLKDFERSIRPFDISRLELAGTDTNLRVSLTATTYYQPGKSLKLDETKEVK